MFCAILYVYEKKDGGSKSHFSTGYKRDQFRMMNIKVIGKVTAIMNNKDKEIKKIIPGDCTYIDVQLIKPIGCELGMRRKLQHELFLLRRIGFKSLFQIGLVNNQLFSSYV
ncbi:hypothetical protein GQ457_08G024090 [Hibiscus cannabinus]